MNVSGIASCNIGGVTVHSFAGIGLGVESAEQLAVKVKRNKKASSRWLRTRVLIIDEGVAYRFYVNLCAYKLLFDSIHG